MDLLDRYIASEAGKPFAWGCGNADCILFACGWGQVLKGIDFGAPWRGLYRDKASSRSLLDRHVGLAAAIIDSLGPPRMGSDARRGDVGLLQARGLMVAMICEGQDWAARDEIGVRSVRVEPDLVWSMGFQP